MAVPLKDDRQLQLAVQSIKFRFSNILYKNNLLLHMCIKLFSIMKEIDKKVIFLEKTGL